MDNEQKKLSEEGMVESNLEAGTYDKIETKPIERKKQVEFELGKEIIVTMDCDKPQEFQSKEGKGVFYVFDVIHEEESKSIVTSAITLLRGLKMQEPYMKKELKIVKKKAKAKYFYNVEENKGKGKIWCVIHAWTMYYL